MEFLCNYCLALMAFLLCLLIRLCLLKKSLHDHNPKLPPGPWQLPIIGSVHHFLRGSKIPQRKLRDLARAYGPLMHLKLGQLHAVVVSSARAAEEILKTHDLQFADRADSVAMDIITYGRKDVGMAPYGEYWRQMRKICVLELLSAKRVQSFTSVRDEEAANLIQSICSAGDTATINLTQMLSAYSSSVLGRAAFGRRCMDAAEFISVFDEIKKLVVGVDLADFFPSCGLVVAVSGVRRRAWKLRRRCDGILEKIIVEHKERRKSRVEEQEEEEDEDLLDVLLRIEEQSGLEFPLTDEHVKATILDIFAGGSDTSSILMDWAMTELMKNPRVMAKAQAEAREVLRGKEAVTSENIQELRYLTLIIKETLRLHPPVPLLLPRKCRESCQIGGYAIPKNTTTIINAWALGRDPAYWDEPETFLPERFESNANTINFKGTNYEYIPFGSGRRICPGMLFGLAATEVMLGKLLYYFDWKLPQGMAPDDLDMNEVTGSGWNRAKDLFVCASSYKL